MPRPKWRPDEQLTPFARLVREWMWRQVPPMSVPQLADLTGISKQAIWGWFQHDSLPRRDTVLALARATGLDTDELLRAAGLPDTRASEVKRRGAARIYGVLLKRIERELRSDPRLSDSDIAAMLAVYQRIGPEVIEQGLAVLLGEAGADLEGEAGMAGEAAPPAERDAPEPPEEPHQRRRKAITGAPR